MANIYIHMEIRKRELEGKFFLASKAALRGHRVMLGYLHPLLDKDLLMPGIFHDKSITPRLKKIGLLRTAKSAGHAYTTIDEEHGLLQKEYDMFARERYSAETLDLANAVMFWGPHDHDFMTKQYPSFRDKMHLTGNPRADLWRPEMAPVFQETLPVRKPFILLASNLGSIFGQRSIEEMITHMRTGYFKGPYDETEFNMYRLYSYSALLGGEYIKALRRLALEFPDVDFVLRPHPTEKPEIWNNLIGDYKNIIVTNAGSVTPWIRQCAALIHNGCTTAMEAVKSGVPVLTYTPIEDQNAQFYFANLLGRRISDIESLVVGVRDALNMWPEQSGSPDDQRILAQRFTYTGGNYAADRMIQVWESLAKPHHNSATFWKQGGKPWFKSFGDFVDVSRVITPRMRKLAGNRKYPVMPQKFGVWSQSELDTLQERFSKQFSEFRALKVTKIAPRLCVFENAA